MHKLKHAILYIVLAYSALYTTIWFHELGHSVTYHYFGCKNDLLQLNVPVYFANANPYPINELAAAKLKDWQQFYISLAGILTNLILSLLTWLVINIKLLKHYKLFYFFLSFFLLSNLIEAFTYLTISNIYPTGDMNGIQQFSPLSRIPLFFLGLLLVFPIITLITNASPNWRRGMMIFSIVSTLAMGGLRFLFTII